MIKPPSNDPESTAAVSAVARIAAVPHILDVLCRSTGMGFAAIAHVTERRWIACSVRDGIQFGLPVGGELEVATTICREVREARDTVAIDHVSKDDVYCGHPTPALYGFQSYVSTPILLADGSFFGTLCAIDPNPARVNTPETLGMFKLFAELIAMHLDAGERLERSEQTLSQERQDSELREQFIAVLGHDLRNPLNAIVGSADALLMAPADPNVEKTAARIKRAGKRMAALIDDVLDFARGRLGAGLSLALSAHPHVDELFAQVIAELRVTHPERVIDAELGVDRPVRCDATRLSQLASNLLANALVHGATDTPILVRTRIDGDTFELTVSNGGVPIPPALIGQLFRPFFRGHVMPSQQGLGLGLYIAFQIARAHDGTLDVRSDATATTFRLRMPR